MMIYVQCVMCVMYPRDPQCNVRFYLLASADQGTSSDPINTDTILMRSFRLNIDTIQAWNEDGAGMEEQRNRGTFLFD